MIYIESDPNIKKYSTQNCLNLFRLIQIYESLTRKHPM